ncbi:hypothetical protein JJQ59_37780 (plasmid) [Cupriavidus necator]|nr:hypothetical protein [Cupriavidus necator]QQX89293.1 hypothetical protein JJQ59_37780 [Cupriavidus necator]
MQAKELGSEQQEIKDVPSEGARRTGQGIGAGRKSDSNGYATPQVYA